MGENEMSDEKIVNHEEALLYARMHPESNLARCYLALNDRLKATENAKVPDEVDIEEMIFVWSMRPKPDTATGAAWENGARHGWAWRQKHIDILRDLLKRETEECQRQTRENFRLARLHKEAERQLAAMKSNEMQKRMAEWMKR
jgi:hypothetical protein